ARRASSSHASGAARDAPSFPTRRSSDLFGEFLQDVGTELALEVALLQAAGFELQHHLAKKALARRHGERPAQRQLSLIEQCDVRSEEHTSELQSQSNLVCRLLLEKKKKN